MPKNITSYLNEHVNLLFCIFLIILSLYFLLFIKKREGFNWGDVGRAFKKVDNAFNKAAEDAKRIAEVAAAATKAAAEKAAAETKRIAEAAAAEARRVAEELAKQAKSVDEIIGIMRSLGDKFKSIPQEINKIGSVMDDVKNTATSGINEINNLSKELVREMDKMQNVFKSIPSEFGNKLKFKLKI